jgi:hypothetical protein
VCAVLFWRLIIEPKKFKININIDPDLARAYGLGDSIPAEFLRFQLIGNIPQSVEKDWERAIMNAFRARDRAISFQFGRRKVTCIVEQHDKKESGDIPHAGIDNSGLNCAQTSNDRLGEFRIKFMGFPPK